MYGDVWRRDRDGLGPGLRRKPLGRIVDYRGWRTDRRARGSGSSPRIHRTPEAVGDRSHESPATATGTSCCRRDPPRSDPYPLSEPSCHSRRVARDFEARFDRQRDRDLSEPVGARGACCAVPCRSPAGRSALHASMAPHRAVLAGGQGSSRCGPTAAARQRVTLTRLGLPQRAAAGVERHRPALRALGPRSDQRQHTVVDARRDPVGVDLVRDVGSPPLEVARRRARGARTASRSAGTPPGARRARRAARRRARSKGSSAVRPGTSMVRTRSRRSRQQAAGTSASHPPRVLGVLPSE